MTRRTFLGGALASTTALAAATPLDTRRPSSRAPLIDTNVSLGHWPLRRLPADEPERLVSKLRAHGVTQAWAGSFDSLLHKDLASANARLAEMCRRHGRGLLIPFGSVDPSSPDWEEELRRCAGIHRMPGIRLFPNYHGYQLDDPAFARLLAAAAELGLLVQLALVMEDERMMHPLLRVEPVATQPLADLVRTVPTLQLQLVNALRALRAKPLLDLVATGRVSVEISMLEGVGGVENLLRQIPADRVLFGSHAPLFYFESAALKLQESDLTATQLQSIRAGNARQLLKRIL